MLDHFLDNRDVVLQVGIQADQCVTLDTEQASQQCILMAAVSRQLNAVHPGSAAANDSMSLQVASRLPSST